jgi:hypothetical protein
MRTIALLGCLILPSWAQAQTLQQNDATVSVAWAGSEYHRQDYDGWQSGALFGVSAGHYWTTHLKTDIELGWSSPATSTTFGVVTVGSLQTYAETRHRFQDVRLALGQSYQFGRNAWVHPYVGAGADIIRRQAIHERSAQTGFVSSGRSVSVTVPAFREADTAVHVHLFVKSGLKMYATERAFFATELKLGFGSDLDHAQLKLGVGFDF